MEEEEEEGEEEDDDTELKSKARPTKGGRKMVVSEPEPESGEDQEGDSENEPASHNKAVSVFSGLTTLLTMSRNRLAMKPIPPDCSRSPRTAIR